MGKRDMDANANKLQIIVRLNIVTTAVPLWSPVRQGKQNGQQNGFGGFSIHLWLPIDIHKWSNLPAVLRADHS